MRLVPPAAALLIGAALAACGGGSSPAVAPAPVAQASLVYPTAPTVSAFGPTLIFAVSGLSAPYTFAFAPTPNPGNTPTVTVSPTTLPSGLAPPPAGTTYVSVSVVQLPVVSTVTVSLAGCPVSAAAPCAVPQTVAAGTIQTDCGLPPPVPSPYLIMALPANGTTGVSTGIGQLILQGFTQSYFGSTTLAMTSASGAAVAIGTPTTTPSPLPSPLPSPNGLFYAATVPVLSPATTYTLTFSYTDFGNNPPLCRTPVTVTLSNFTTR